MASLTHPMPPTAGSWAGSGCGRSLVQVDANDVGYAAEVDIGSEQRRVVALGDGGDHAVDHPAWGHARSTATSVDARRCIEVSGDIEGEQVESQQETS